MLSPSLAMLWEQWRLTRVEAAQRLGLGLAGGSAALALLDADKGATAAFWILIVLHGMVIWLSIAKLNGGRFMDGYKPGFPFYLAYVRPVPTVLFVGLTLVYDAVSCAALYVVSAALLGFAFGQSLPLFSVIPWIVAFHLAYACAQYSTPNRTVQWVGSFAFSLPLALLLIDRLASPLQVEFSLVDNILFVAIALVSFSLTVAGVARQRRGGAASTVPRATGGWSGCPDWLISLFTFACPTSSAMRAQVWFELKGSGLPVLATGFAAAGLIFLLFAAGILVAPLRAVAIGAPLLFTFPLVVMLGGNAFGIRRRQGRADVNAFDATQPSGTAQLAGIKVLVRSACVMTALIAIALSLWASSLLVSAWGTWVVHGGTDAAPGLLKLRHQIEQIVAAQSGFVLAALTVITFISVAATVSWLATRGALRARFPRLLIVAEWLPIACGLALVLLGLAGRNGILSMSVARSIIGASGVIALAAIVPMTVYILWSGFLARALTLRYLHGAVGVALVFAVAWLTVLHAAGIRLTEMPWASLVWLLSPLPLLFMNVILVPWSLNRIRHT